MGKHVGYIVMDSKALSSSTKKGRAARAKWVGRTVISKAGVEYCIIRFCYSPYTFYSDDDYKQRTPPYGVWMQRTDGTYQMRFLTVPQYNQLMVLDKKGVNNGQV